MVKAKKPKKSGFQKIMAWPKTHKILAIVLVLVIGYFGYNFTAKYIEKRDLDNKTAQINELADKISGLYPPDERTSEQYCDYSNQKFEKGDLSCVTQTNLKYKNVNESQATKLMETISQQNQLDIKESTFPKTEKIFFSYNSELNKWSSYFAYPFEGEDKCSIGFYYETEKVDNQMLVSIDCYNSNSNYEHYPVKN